MCAYRISRKIMCQLAVACFLTIAFSDSLYAKKKKHSEYAYCPAMKSIIYDTFCHVVK